MGFRICYIATTASPNELVEALNLNLGEVSNEMPQGSWWIARLKGSDWTLLWSENEEFGQSSIKQIETLSELHKTYLCEVNETVMWSSAELWVDGEKLWKVSHTGDEEDKFQLSEYGKLPENYTKIVETHFADQKHDGEDVDHVFEVPLNLVASEIGFRHEDHLEASDVEEFLLVTPPKKKGLFSRLFGG